MLKGTALEVNFPMSTFKVLYNACYGGFQLSQEFVSTVAPQMQETHGSEWESYFESWNLDMDYRTDERFIRTFEELGSERSSCGRGSKISVKEFPIEYWGCIGIDEYDGSETIRIDKSLYASKLLKTAHEGMTTAALMHLIDEVLLNLK